jgi:branched-chain amino acid transport system permease protein
MSVIGGGRTIAGAIIGSFMLTGLSEALRALQAYRLILYGGILIFTVIYMPQGLVGLADSLKHLVQAHRGISARPSGEKKS